MNAEFVATNSGAETAAGATVGGSSSTFESSNFVGQQGGAAYSGYESAQGGNVGDLGYESTSYTTQNVDAYGDANASGYQTYNISTGSNIDLAGIAFKNADLNKDGVLDPNEFRQFITSRPQYVYD